MGQVTIYLDEQTEKLVKRHVKASRMSASRWIAETLREKVQKEWPPDVLALFGSWNDGDFQEAKDLRRGYGKDVRREKF